MSKNTHNFRKTRNQSKFFTASVKVPPTKTKMNMKMKHKGTRNQSSKWQLLKSSLTSKLRESALVSGISAATILRLVICKPWSFKTKNNKFQRESFLRLNLMIMTKMTLLKPMTT